MQRGARRREHGKEGLWLLAVAILYSGLAALALAADVGSSGDPLAIAEDVLVGIAFGIAAALGGGPRLERAMFAAVGIAWLTGSLMPLALTLHQAVLLVALAAFPSGRLRGIRWLGVPVGIVLGLQLPAEPVAGALWLGVAGLELVAGPLRGIWYPAAAASLVGAAIEADWILRGAAAFAVPLLYPSAIGLCALGFLVASRSSAWASSGIADVLLRTAASGDLAHLTEVLRHLLRDRGLNVLPVAQHTGGLVVTDGEAQVATVVGRSPLLRDPAIASGVEQAVRLTLAHGRLRTAELREVQLLEDSRRRLLATADRERTRAARLLASEVGLPLERAIAALLQTARNTDMHAPSRRDVVLAELADAAAQISLIVRGSPPTALGNGLLAKGLERMAHDLALPTSLEVAPDMSGDVLAEETLFYVCAEATANALRHSGATRVSIRARRVGDELELVVEDDGRGGANPEGRGLASLADRVAVASGSLSVVSPPGIGTTVRAIVPAGPQDA